MSFKQRVDLRIMGNSPYVNFCEKFDDNFKGRHIGRFFQDVTS